MFARNPGLHFENGSRADGVAIAFQPEVGSVTTPEYESMRRFLSPAVLEAVPPKGAGMADVHPVWAYHAYIPMTDANGTDHVYCYGAPSNASEYAAQAQFAQYAQYRALYEGFQEHAWRWYGAVILWKSNSPWPAFRGALYDSYLAPNGGLWGVRAATRGVGGLHIQLNQAAATVTVLNKGLLPSVPVSAQVR